MFTPGNNNYGAMWSQLQQYVPQQVQGTPFGYPPRPQGMTQQHIQGMIPRTQGVTPQQRIAQARELVQQAPRGLQGVMRNWGNG